jgi:hypothetical protein
MARFGFGDSDVSAMIEGWRARKKEFGCRCIVRPPGWSYGQEEREAAANATIVTSRMFGGSGTYADWSGSTGPGALLRKILKEEREKKDE